MMNSFRHLRNTWLQLHFLLLFVVYYAGSNFFAHTHSIDGKPVAHSHPFAGSNGHQHTTAEFSVLSLLTHFSATPTTVCTAVAAFRVVVAILGKYDSISRLTFYFHRSNFLRPPPSLQPLSSFVSAT
ncbi:MAG: hypothetical protein F9K10_00115 [Paludibacter sp.]|nr:MAG: hypothetical protein F9K10_00115 [Paludibacter sp.]